MVDQPTNRQTDRHRVALVTVTDRCLGGANNIHTEVHSLKLQWWSEINTGSVYPFRGQSEIQHIHPHTHTKLTSPRMQQLLMMDEPKSLLLSRQTVRLHKWMSCLAFIVLLVTVTTNWRVIPSHTGTSAAFVVCSSATFNRRPETTQNVWWSSSAQYTRSRTSRSSTGPTCSRAGWSAEAWTGTWGRS